MSASETAAPKQGLGDLLAIRAFRRLLIANVLSAIAFGTSRFVFVWLVGELTEWNPATAILGIVIGLPPLLLSAWAGALADRLDDLVPEPVVRPLEELERTRWRPRRRVSPRSRAEGEPPSVWRWGEDA